MSAPRQCLIEAEFDARELQRSALYLGTLIGDTAAFSVHVLHSLAAAAAEMGFSELTIAGLLGHSVPGVTAR